MFEVSAESQPPNESTINVRGHDDINSSRNLYTNVRVAILSGILFLSGIGALIFETLWLRLSGLAFGNSIWAAALILSSFMAGLALGNAIAASSKGAAMAATGPGVGRAKSGGSFPWQMC
jgi:hypothetical protein